MRMLFILAALSLVVANASNAIATPTDSLSFQGRLTNLSGDPIDADDLSITFTIYKGGSPVWMETQLVDVVDGIYNVFLGAVTPLDTVPFDQAMQLGVKVDSEPSEILPRIPLVSGAFARALPGLYTFRRAGTTTGLPSEALNIIAGENHTVGPSVVGAVIGGGGGELNGSPVGNDVLGDFGTVGGGFNNSAGDEFAVVAGGRNNDASGNGASIGGGTFNVASASTTVVAGGSQNQATGLSSFVGSGSQNMASGVKAFLGGGQENSASGDASVVTGGYQNEATEMYATVPGGYLNIARGLGSFAGGTLARANNFGSFVWQDGTGELFGDTLSSTLNNQFVVRATGGVIFYTDRGDTAGVILDPGAGAWATLSDVASKTGFEDVDALQILDRLADMPIRKWRYRAERSRSVHLGPTAQDFHKAFGLGPDDRHIVTLDADGVALAAIKALHGLVEEQQAEIERMRAAMERAGIK